MIHILFRGIMMGFAIGAVVGPIGILCIQRTLTYGFAIGLATGIGAALADATYGGIAAFGLTIIKDTLLAYTTPLKIIGGAYLLYLGYQTFNTKPAQRTHAIQKVTFSNAIGSTFLLTMTNPVTIMAFLSIFVSANLEYIIKDYSAASLIVFGVFVGSTLWWILLSGLSTLLRTKLNVTMLTWINRISGILITGFACKAFFDVFSSFVFS